MPELSGFKPAYHSVCLEQEYWKPSD